MLNLESPNSVRGGINDLVYREFYNDYTGKMDCIGFPKDLTGICSQCEFFNICGMGKSGLTDCINDGGASEREQKTAE